MANDLIQHLSDATFESAVLNAQQPVLLTFGLNGVVPAK